MCSFLNLFYDRLLDLGSQFTAGLELNDFFGSDLNGLSCLGIAARPGASFTYGKRTETYQGDTVTFFERITCGVNKSIQSFFCISF